MSNELFDVPVCKSPRLLWIEKHNIKTHFNAECEEPWACWSGELEKALRRDGFATGNTEDEAITNWARERRVLMWNEERK